MRGLVPAYNTNLRTKLRNTKVRNHESSAFRISYTFRMFVKLDELDDERYDECVDRDSFRERDSEDHGRLDLRSCFGVASDSLHSLSGEEPDTDTRADCPRSDGDCCCN